MADIEEKDGRSPAEAGSGQQASPSAAEEASSQGAVPNAICGYPLPGWRLDHVQWSRIEGQPDGWIVSLHRAELDWDRDRRAFVVMARSDLGPLEAWDEALRIALREDARAKAKAEQAGQS